MGRRPELDRLEARLAALCEGGAGGGRGGGIVLISGEPGVGKTALARETAIRAAARGATVLQAACFEGEWQPPYHLWTELLRDRAATLDPSAPGAAVIAGLMGLGTERTAAGPPGLPADEEQRRLIDAMTSWLLAIAAAEPALVLLEDLQWADPDSLAILRRAARAAARIPLLIVGTHRSGESPALDDLLAHVSREADVMRIGLGGFSVEEVGEYLARTTGDALPAAIVRAIHDETRGNPFFVREVLSHLIEEAKIARRDGRWTTEASIAELGIPDSVRRVVRRRVARLSPAAQETLAAAAAFTAGIEPAVLAQVVDRSEAEVLDALDEAVAAGVMAAMGDRRASYDFSHAIVRHALYEELGGARRREVHARVAAAIDAAPPSSRRTAELAAQHYRAGSRGGVAHCVAAADQARAGHANEQAVRFLRMAVELDTMSGQPDARLLARLAIAEAEALALDAAAVTAARAIDALADPDEITTFVVSVARLLKEAGAPGPGWRPLVERGLALVGDRRDLAWARLRLLISPMAPLAEAGVHVGRWMGHDPAAVARVDAEGSEEDRARTVEAWDWRSPEETMALLETARTWRSPAAILRAYEAANRSLLFRHGDVHGAEQLMQELLEAAGRWGSVAAQGEAFTQLALCHAFLGQVGRAQEELDEARVVVEPLGPLHRQQLAVSVSHAILVGYLGPHDAPGADWRRWGERAARLVEQPFLSRSVPLGLICAGLGALAFGVGGDTGRARALVDPLTTLLERSAPRDYGAPGALWMAVAACWHLSRTDLAARHTALVDRFEAAGIGAGPFTSWSLARARLCGDPALFAAARVELEGLGHRTLASMAAAEGAPAAPLPARSPLTSREAQILGLIAGGYTNQEIAGQLHVSVPTVNRHVANLYVKIGARNRASATAYAVRLQGQATT